MSGLHSFPPAISCMTTVTVLFVARVCQFEDLPPYMDAREDSSTTPQFLSEDMPHPDLFSSPEDLLAQQPVFLPEEACHRSKYRYTELDKDSDEDINMNPTEEIKRNQTEDAKVKHLGQI